MKHRRVFVALFCVLSSAAAAPQAAAAEPCQWKVHDLYWPDSRSETRGSSPDDHLIVGATWPGGHERGLVWDNGVWSLMAAPANVTDSITPNSVNNSGVVVGRHRACSNRDGEFHHRAFRYQNGVYQYLDTAAEEESQAIGINEAGDIIGQVWRVSAPGVRWVALWPRDNQPRRLYLKASAIGITDDRKLVVTQDPEGSNPKVWAIDSNTGAWTAFPGARTPVVLDDDRVLTYNSTLDGPQIQEWTLDGRQVGAYAKGWVGHGRNSAGTVFGWSATSSRMSLWQGRTRTDVVADKRHYGSIYADITDDGRLIGTYRDAQNVDHAALWYCS